MSDHCIIIAPRQSNYPNPEEKAREVLSYLISYDIIEGMLTDCTLGEKGYPISDGARSITDEPKYLPFGLAVNGLSIITHREVFHTGGNGIDEIICPSCDEDILAEDWDLTDWSEGVTDDLICPLCHKPAEINRYKFEPAWGFSNLGFKFWNWPELNAGFIEEIKRMLGTDIVVVWQVI